MPSLHVMPQAPTTPYTPTGVERESRTTGQPLATTVTKRAVVPITNSLCVACPIVWTLYRFGVAGVVLTPLNQADVRYAREVKGIKSLAVILLFEVGDGVNPPYPKEMQEQGIDHREFKNAFGAGRYKMRMATGWRPKNPLIMPS